MLKHQLKRYPCCHHVLLLLLLLCYLKILAGNSYIWIEFLAGNLNSKCKMQTQMLMQNANANRLSVKPFISTDLFLLFRQCEIWTHDYLVWGWRNTNWATKQITNTSNQKLYLSYYCHLYTNTNHTSRIIRTFNLRVGVIGSLVSWIAMLPHDPESWVRVSLNKVITHKISLYTNHCMLHCSRDEVWGL